MTDQLLVGQALLVGAVVALAGVMKIADPRAATTAARTALGRRLPNRIDTAAAWRFLGVVEIAIGAAAVLRVGGRSSAVALSCSMAASVAYGVWSANAEPEAPCGCLGSLSRAPAGKLTVGRAGALFVLSVLAVIPGTGLSQWNPGVAVIGVLLAELVLIGAMFPELRGMLRRRGVDCGWRAVPLDETLASLRSGRLWAAASPYLESVEPIDHWRQACWRYLTFSARYAETPATAVFAVKLDGTSKRNSVAFADRDSDAILGHMNLRTLSRRRGLARTAVAGFSLFAILTAGAWGAERVGNARAMGRNSNSTAYPAAIYPAPARHPDWGSPNACASLSGLRSPGANAQTTATNVVKQLQGRPSQDRRHSDRAFWPLLNQSKGPAYGKADTSSAGPASRSPYAKLVANNCGSRIVALSERVVVRPKGSGRSGGALNEEYWVLDRRGHWLVWFAHP